VFIECDVMEKIKESVVKMKINFCRLLLLWSLTLTVLLRNFSFFFSTILKTIRMFQVSIESNLNMYIEFVSLARPTIIYDDYDDDFLGGFLSSAI
jgi:hypothetical protein